MEAATAPPHPGPTDRLARGDGSPPLGALVAGQAVRGRYAVARKDRQTARNGSPYLALELRDRTGQATARAFRDVDLIGSRFETGDVVEVEAKVVRFRGEEQLELSSLRRLEPDRVEPEEYLPRAWRDPDELEGFLEHLVGEVAEPALRATVEATLGEDAAAFRRAPCTRAGHHSYLGGLLEHTVAVATLAGELRHLHPRVDLDLLVAAALVHDVGRSREFTYGAEIGLSEEGRLLGHLHLGAEIVGRAAGRSGLDPGRRAALLHCVLTHHGPDGRGFGSVEALTLARLNSLDAGVKGAVERGIGLGPGRGKGQGLRGQGT